jgi:hypothetical protein
MADVAVRPLSKNKVFSGRLVSIAVYDNSTPVKFTTLDITTLSGETVTATEEVVDSTVELEDGTEITEKAGRRVTAEATISEVSTADMALINAATKIVFTTATGGTGSGMTFTIDDPDVIYCQLEGLKTKITAKKSTVTPTLPYVIAAV